MVAAGFRKRKINCQKGTLGDSLKRARRRRAVSLREAEEATRIRARFLSAIESDAWEQLPETYGRGYLLQYADYLGISRPSITAAFNRERKLLEHRSRRRQESLSFKRSVMLPRFYVTSRVASYVVAGLLVLVLGGYLTMQVNKFAAVPLLTIATPTTADASPVSAVIVNEPTVTVTGQTSVGAEVIINDEPATVDSEGVFHHKLELMRGENIIQIKAVNRSGAERVELMKVVADY